MKESDIAAVFAGKPPNVQVYECYLSVKHPGTPAPDPLFVVDGVPLDNAGPDIANVDPNDIENVSILKSVAASAIFGARGSNGAVLITTKHPSGNHSQ